MSKRGHVQNWQDGRGGSGGGSKNRIQGRIR